MARYMEPNSDDESVDELFSEEESEWETLPPLTHTYADRNKPNAKQQGQSTDDNADKMGENAARLTKFRPIKAMKVQTGSGITQINKLSDTNWVNWREDILRMLTLLKVKDYPLGLVLKPDLRQHPNSANVWIHNDSYALHLISLNLTESQKIHIS